MWKITSIRNDTHELTLTKTETGEKLFAVIPEANRGSLADKAAYLKSQTDAYDSAVLAKVIPITAGSSKVAVKHRTNLYLCGIIALETITIVLMHFTRFF